MKNKTFAFRIREEDLQIIRKKASKAKMTTTDYFTSTALGKELMVIDGLPDMIRELKAIGRNLNQMTTLANMGKIDALYLEQVLQVFGGIYEQLRLLSQRKH